MREEFCYQIMNTSAVNQAVFIIIRNLQKTS